MVLMVVAILATGCATSRRDSLGDGLVLHYTFDTGTGNIVSDASGNGNDGTVHGAEFVVSGSGYALKLDGTDDYVECPAVRTNGADLQAFTLTAWVRILPREKPEGEAGIVGFGGPIHDHAGVTYTHVGGTWFRPWFYVGGKDNKVFDRVSYHDWVNLAAVFDGSTLKLYVNGMLTMTEESKQAFTGIGGDETLYVGKNVNTCLKGEVDEVRVYARALSAEEINRHFVTVARDKGVEVTRTEAEIAAEIRQGFHQAVKNPYFREWTGDAPTAWEVDDGVTVVKDDFGLNSERTGLKGDSAKLVNPPPGKGIHQDLTVRPGILYVLSSYVHVEGKGKAILRITGRSGHYYSGRRFRPSEYWWHEAIDVRPIEGETTIRLSIIRDPGDDPNETCNIRVDNTILATAHSPTDHPKPELPNPPLMMFGFKEEQAERWDEVLQVFNIIGGNFRNAARVREMEKSGTLFAQGVHHYYASPWHVNADGTPVRKDKLWHVTRDGLIASLACPFVDTMDGELPDGFKAMVWDEMQGHPNRSEIMRVHVDALAEIRQRFPNKLIICFATNDLGTSWPTKGGPFDDYEKAFANALAVNKVGGRMPVPDPRDRPNYPDNWEALRAIRDYADLHLQECYIFESDFGQLEWIERMAANMDTLAPGVLEKTLFTLMICDTRDEQCSNSPHVLFKEFLDAQFHRVVNSAAASKTPGICLYPLYRSGQDTTNHVCELARHYFVEGKRDYYGLGHFVNPVPDPSFEGWADVLGPGMRVVRYGPDTVPQPAGRAYPTRQLEAGHRLVRMSPEGRPHECRQRVRVRAPGWYTLSAWFWSKGKEPLRLSAYLVEGEQKKLLATRDVMPWYAGYWTIGRVTFDVPPDKTKPGRRTMAEAEIALSDAAVEQPVAMFVDCVEVEPTYGINRPTVIDSVEPKTVAAGDTLTIHGSNFKPASYVLFNGKRFGYATWLSANTAGVTIPADLKPGMYDIGIQPRMFLSGADAEIVNLPKAVEVK